MKRLLLLVSVASAVGSASLAYSPTYVYITKTGQKYHRDGCRYLRQSKIKIELGEAKKKHYEPCKVCHPPVAMVQTQTLVA